MKKIICGIIILVLFISVCISGCGHTETEYERAGRTFSSWTKKDPSEWTATERKYMDNMLSNKDSY